MAYQIVSVRRCVDGGYRVYISDAESSARPIRKRFQASNDEAAEAVAQRILDDANGEWKVSTALDMFLSSAAERVCASTFRSYKVAAKLLDPLRIETINRLSPSYVQSFLDDLSSRYGRSSVKNAKNILSASCELAVESGAVTQNPCRGVHAPYARPLQPPDIDVARLRKFLQAMRGPIPCATALVLECRLSLGEICGLVQDDFRADTVLVRRKVSYYFKGECDIIHYSDAREKTVPPWLMVAIRRLPDDGPYVFGSNGRPGNANELSRHIRWLLSSVGIECSARQLAKVLR